MAIKNTNQEIGAYLRKQIGIRYKSNRKFCKAYVGLAYPGQDEAFVDGQVAKETNRLCQILKGKKGIQTYDLPIYSKLLGLSYEEILSAGKEKVPTFNRMTNYSVAMSKDRKVWESYLNSENRLVAYADEYGKTILDYALEFENYKLIKYLMEQKAFWLVGDDRDRYWKTFGAGTDIKARPLDEKFADEVYQDVKLRTKILALALKSDDSVLDALKAREIPCQYNVSFSNADIYEAGELYDDGYVEAILEAKDKAFAYFIEEYEIALRFTKSSSIRYIFPFIDKLIEKGASSNSGRTLSALDAAIQHNRYVYESMRKKMLEILHRLKDEQYPDLPIKDVLGMVGRDFQINKEKNFCLLWSWIAKDDTEFFASNIVHVNVKSSDPTVLAKAEELNRIYESIVSLPKNLIKTGEMPKARKGKNKNV